MKPLDRRLLAYAQSTRWFLILAVVLGAAMAAVVIAQARLLSTVIVDVTAGGQGWVEAAPLVAGLAVVFGLRALLASGSEIAAFRASARAKQELRETTIRHLLAAGPAGPAGQDPGGVATLVTRGIDGLDGYFARYLPQLVLAVIVPVAVLLTILGQDLLSTLIIAVTLPLIPMFMVLIGLYTRGRVDRQWRTLEMLSGHFLDLVAGLPTLKAFGRAKAQAQAIQSVGDRYRQTTMGVLRISFLSSLVLELLATLSVALVAVSVGLRLAEQQVSYGVALFVLLLAPEAYLPLRLVGQHFHAAAEGLGAADRMFALIEASMPETTSRHGARPLDAQVTGVRVTDLTVTYPGRDRPALERTTFVAPAGQITAIVGPSGGGKSTLMNALMAFIPPTDGTVEFAFRTAGSWSLADADPVQWRSVIGWVPQRAVLIDGQGRDASCVRDIVRIGQPTASDDEVWQALAWAGVADEIRSMPHGLDTVVRADGTGVSIGQQQRLALARALIRRPDVLLLDEPTAALDGHSEAAVLQAIREQAARGAVVIVVAHRPAIIADATWLVRVGSHPGQIEPRPAATAASLVLGSSGW